jgi:hypothetical protein
MLPVTGTAGSNATDLPTTAGADREGASTA